MKIESRTTNVFKNVLSKLLQRFASIIVKFALRTIFIYLLGKEYTGLAGLFTDVLIVLSLMEAGLETSMVYALYKPLAEKNERKIKALLKFYKEAFTFIGIGVLVIGLSLTPFLCYIVKNVPHIREDIRLIFFFYVITSASSYFFVYRTVLLNADQKSRAISKWRTLVLIGEFLIEAFCLCIFRQFIIYLSVHFFATIISNVIVSRVATKMYPQYLTVNNQEHLTKEETKKIICDILCLTVYNFSGIVINSTDSIFISAFVGTVEVAVLGNFTSIINSVRTVISQVVEVTKSSIGNLAVTTEKKSQEVVFERMNFIAFYAATLCCSLFFTLLNPFIGDLWFDATYKVSILTVGILSVNFYIAVMVYPVESFRTANGLFVQGWIRPVIMAILNILLDFYMGSRWGVIGILLATTIARLTTQVWFDPYLVFKYVFDKKPWEFLMDYIFKFMFVISVSVATYVIANNITGHNVYLDFTLKMIISFCIPNIILSLAYWKNPNYRYLFRFILMKSKYLRQ